LRNGGRGGNGRYRHLLIMELVKVMVDSVAGEEAAVRQPGRAKAGSQETTTRRSSRRKKTMSPPREHSVVPQQFANDLDLSLIHSLSNGRRVVIGLGPQRRMTDQEPVGVGEVVGIQEAAWSVDGGLMQLVRSSCDGPDTQIEILHWCWAA
jgi:hypothetical protein